MEGLAEGETEQMPLAEQGPWAAVAKGRVDIEGGLIQVAAPRDGIVKEVMVEEGDRVSKDQVLAIQDVEVAKLDVNETEAALAQASAQIGLLEARQRAARREVERLTPLVDARAEARKTLDEARDRVSEIEAEIAVAKTTIMAAEARVERSRYEVSLRTIRAPADGLIIRRNARPGVCASTVNVTSLFTLAPDLPRIVRADVEEAQIPKVKLGQKALISPEAAPETSTTATVIRVAQVLGQKKTDDPNERVDERVIEVVLSAPDMPYLIGQRVLVRFEAAP